MVKKAKRGNKKRVSKSSQKLKNSKKKSVSNKKSTRKSNKKVRSIRATKRKLKLAGKNLLTFILLGLISYGLSRLNFSDFMSNVFLLFVILFGVISLAFLIVFLILLFMKFANK